MSLATRRSSRNKTTPVSYSDSLPVKRTRAQRNVKSGKSNKKSNIKKGTQRQLRSSTRTRTLKKPRYADFSSEESDVSAEMNEDDMDIDVPSSSFSSVSLSEESFEEKKPVKKPVKKSVKNAKNTKKIESFSQEDSEESYSFSNEESIEDKKEVEKILGMKKDEDETTFLIKYKGESYLHTEWITEGHLYSIVPKSRVSRFLKGWLPKKVYYNPNFEKIERVISYRKKGEEGEYLVKFHSLEYKDCCWEPEPFVRENYPELVQHFESRTYPSKEEIKQCSITTPRSSVQFDEDMQMPEFNNGYNLRDYQEIGFKWLVYSWYNNRNTILADEMGLGKTIQGLSMFHWLSQNGVRGPFLVVAPMSVLEQWQREIHDWTHLNAVIYHGTKESREQIIKSEFFFDDKNRKDQKLRNLYKFNVLITSYDYAKTDKLNVLNKIFWKYIIIDEAHALKNAKAKLFTSLKNFQHDHCLLLTGTPIQNDTSELWTLLNFIDSENFSSLSTFSEKYGTLNTKEQIDELQEVLNPYMLRRLKEDVAKSIPSKVESVIQVHLTVVQKKFIRALLDGNKSFLCQGADMHNRPSLMNILLQQRKVCNHPFLLKSAEENITRNMDKEEKENSIVTSSAKMVLLDKLLHKLHKEKSKVLIFSQLTSMLDIIEDFMNMRDFSYERLDGSVNRIDRQNAIDRFNYYDDSFAFLLSTKAGGLGLNLTAANTVIIYDSDWNPQNDLQAMARCHRIGQTKNVAIYRFLTSGTYESKMFDVASKKLGLNNALLGNAFGSKKNVNLEADDVENLLKNGVYDLYQMNEEEEKEKENVMMDEDIESILSRASTLTYEEGKPKFTFSNVSFVPEVNTADVGIDDSDFWAKVLPNFANAKELMKSIRNGTISNDEAVKAKFFEEVDKITDNIIYNPEEKSLYSMKKALGELTELYTEIELSKIFTREEKYIARKKRNEIRKMTQGGSQLRAASKSNKNSFSSLRLKTLGAMFDYSGQAKRTKKEKKEKVEFLDDEWNNNEFSKLKRSLLKLGFGRWEEIIHDSGLKRDIEEVRFMSENYVSQLFALENLPEEEREKITEKMKKEFDKEKAKKKSNKKSEKFSKPAEYGIEFLDKAIEYTSQGESEAIFKTLKENGLEAPKFAKKRVPDSDGYLIKYTQFPRQVITEENCQESFEIKAGKKFTIKFTVPGFLHVTILIF
eukprot:TRINITY_DN5859_c0_g2_i2.p1 TRINITY_DN5859_c0_g2~~TRINITY_DN5859_c0_g2_i2.p1  ORF type:complete len:1191 (-),score=312.01 TRINITY_DN5859_c0_g2_i2:660-4232(-)